MNKCVWFSRHALTESQSAEIAAAGYEIFEDAKIAEFAGMNLTSESEVMDIIIRMIALRDIHGVERFYGVFPAVIRSALLSWNFGRNPIELWEAWNITRPPDGGKPSFEHKKFVLTYRG